MNKILNLLSEVVSTPEIPEPPSFWWPAMITLIAILFIPWVILFIYCITVKYRVRVFSDGNLVSTYMFKAKTPLSEIKLPEKEGYYVEGLYRDEEFMLPLEFDVMPKKNLKLYIKWEKNE